MSENHTIIRIFVASPSGLDEERRAILETIENINRRNSSHWLLQFKAIGWEDTVGGNRRAQDIINRDLETCDYFFGLMADRWGSSPYPSGDVKTKYTSGFEEEYELAQKMYQSGKMADIFLFFKKNPEDRMHDAGPSLQKVLEFQKQIHDNRQPLYTEFEELDVFKNKIYNALNKIGWERTTPRPGGAISAPGDQNTDIVEAASIENTEAYEYLLPQSTRDFLNAIQNKSGKANALTNVEVARLRLVSAGVRKVGNDDIYIGVHDANLLFFFRSELDLSRTEKTTLLTAGLQYKENQNVPFWYWTDSNLKRTKWIIQSRMVANDDSVARSALKIAEIFGYRPPRIPKKIDQGIWIKKWFENERNFKLRNAVEMYLSKWAEEDDIPTLQQIGEGKSGQQAANLDCIIVGIKFRNSETEGFRELNKRDPEQISVELQSTLQDAIQCQASDALERLAKRKADYLRLASIRELVRRDALSEDLAEELSGDNSIDVRLEAIKALADKGKHIPESRAKEALVFKKSGLGDLLSGAKGTDDRSKFEDFRRYVLSKKSLDELLAMEEELDHPLDVDALLMACRVFPKQTENLLRSLLKDGFQGRFEKQMAGPVYLSSSQGTELAKKVRKLKGIICLGQTQEALDVLVTQMKQRDLSLVREVIDRQEIEVSGGVHQYLARFGSWDDMERMLKLGDKVKGGSTLLGADYTKTKVENSMAKALAKIGRVRFVDLLERLQSHALLHGVIKAVSGRVFIRLSDEKVLELMHVEDEDVRKVTALRCLQVLPKSRITRLLEKYMEEKEQYYNAIHWLDLGSTMPRSYVQKIVRSELQKL